MDDASLEFLLFALSSADISDHPNRSHHDSSVKQKSTMDLTERRDLLQGTRRPISHLEKRAGALRMIMVEVLSDGSGK
ncbi:hypothetical protein COCNU_04G011220 [Cocos nucifera]|uniref:Uncharacterized protein n=1 Tax=Cocos nucifera TaxID=13894 RepID=A0A8K0I6K0_COCNU|nr:hypothetical protein COCNU_04G011210 [Cocos nucifera]KAG1338816.1 hypothetical protein COCNU_04G011220 [Cocos nucifera]